VLHGLTAIRGAAANLRYRNLAASADGADEEQSQRAADGTGVNYNKQRLQQSWLFRELWRPNPDIDEGLCSLLRVCRETG